MRHRWTKARVGVAALAAGTFAATGVHSSPSGAVVGATPHTVKNCSSMSDIVSCVRGILDPGGGKDGLYLVSGSKVVASYQAGFSYEPASSIKPLIALYAFTLLEEHKIKLTTQIPEISESGGPDDCPPSTFSGKEALGTAIQQMLQVSDNNRTDELMRYFGVAKLNAFAKSLGLTHTLFHTSSSSPGFNVIGCIAYGYNPLPSTVDGNTMSLEDVTRVWRDIDALPAPYAAAFHEMSAGRDMFNSQGYDYTGIWPALTDIATSEAPASLSKSHLQSFVDHMTMSAKGGSYALEDCTPGCQEASWWVFAGDAEIPECSGTKVVQHEYSWGYFINDAVGAYNSNPNDTKAGKAFLKASGQLLAAPIAAGLKNWPQCAPADGKLALTTESVSTSKEVAVTTSLGTLTDSDPTDIADDLTGTIAWGDGTSSVATISGNDGRFTISGWHAYASSGSHTATISIDDIGSGSKVTGTVAIHSS